LTVYHVLQPCFKAIFLFMSRWQRRWREVGGHVLEIALTGLGGKLDAGGKERRVLKDGA
jgi:hypothetical protein